MKMIGKRNNKLSFLERITTGISGLMIAFYLVGPFATEQTKNLNERFEQGYGISINYESSELSSQDSQYFVISLDSRFKF